MSSPVRKGPVAILAIVIFVFFMIFAACNHHNTHHSRYKAPTETNAPATVTDLPPTSEHIVPAQTVEPAPKAEQPKPNEGDPGWDCHTMGNKQCGPGQG